MFVCLCVYMYVCMYMYACMCVCMCVYVCMYVCMYVCTCMHVCVYVCVCMYVCILYVYCMYNVCMHVSCMCMCVYVCTCVGECRKLQRNVYCIKAAINHSTMVSYPKSVHIANIYLPIFISSSFSNSWHFLYFLFVTCLNSPCIHTQSLELFDPGRL